MNPRSALETCSFLLSDLKYCGHMLSVLLLDLFRGRRLRYAAFRLVNITDNDVYSEVAFTSCFSKIPATVFPSAILDAST
jgi:hypothetical protein